MNDKAAQAVAVTIAAVFIVLVCLGALLALLAGNNTDWLKSDERQAAEVAMMAVKREERQSAKPFIVCGVGMFAVLSGIGSGAGIALFALRFGWYVAPAIAESVAPQVAAGQLQTAQLPVVVTEALPAPAGRFRDIVTYGGNNDD